MIGTAPAMLIAELNQRQVRFVQMVVNVPFMLRGKEISDQQLDQLGVCFEECNVTRLRLNW